MEKTHVSKYHSFWQTKTKLSCWALESGFDNSSRLKDKRVCLAEMRHWHCTLWLYLLDHTEMVACSILARRAGLPCTAGEFDRSFFRGRCCCVTISFFSTSFGWVETINFFFSGISVSQIQVGQVEPFSCLGAETRAEARNFFHGDMAAAPKQNHFKGTWIKQNVVSFFFQNVTVLDSKLVHLHLDSWSKDVFFEGRCLHGRPRKPLAGYTDFLRGDISK